MFVADTNVLSHLSPSERRKDPQIVAWFESNGHQIYLSAITIAEVQFGIESLLMRGATRKAATLQQWLDQTVAQYADRVLPVDAAVAMEAGRLRARAKFSGHTSNFRDAAIAATAAGYRMSVLTVNVRDFEKFGVTVINPFGAARPLLDEAMSIASPSITPNADAVG